MTNTERAITPGFAVWLDALTDATEGLREALTTGDFSNRPRPLPGDDVNTEEIEEALTASITDPLGTAATLGFTIGHHTQRNVLQAWRRTERLRRSRRGHALALLTQALEDGQRRANQVETLILTDDNPEGVS